MELYWTIALLLVSTVHSFAGGSGWSGGDHHTIYVKEGEKIQKAINSAPAGSEIVVAAGTYNEQLLIRKDGISLRGEEGAILAPPGTFKRNICSGNVGKGTHAGICIAGSGIRMDDFVGEHRKVRSVQTTVQGVTVSGFQVQDFAVNILVLGAEHTLISQNTLIDGVWYGALTSGSWDTVMEDNIVTSSDPAAPGLIAMCMVCTSKWEPSWSYDRTQCSDTKEIRL
jgi:hypothetical protein